MGVIDKSLEKIDGYLLSIERDTMNGVYFIKIGLPKKWVYESTEKINCELLSEFDEGVLLKVTPVVDSITIDDLITFGNGIVNVNEEIAKMEEEFNKKVESRKEELMNEIKEFEDQLETMKKKSFGDGEHDDDNAKEDVEEKINK